MIKTGFSMTTLKVLLVLIIALIINPITTNNIAYNAFYHKKMEDL